jgi:hypothetical protein
MQWVQSHVGLPSMLWPYCKVLSSSKPLLANANAVIPSLLIEAREVQINAAHLRRYCDICGVANQQVLPPAYLHVLAMPLHMRVFTHADFPVKVLGLVHLRNVIRHWQIITAAATVHLSVAFHTMRETDQGQEYDLITRAHLADQLVWEEISTMLARRITPGKRPSMERAQFDATRVINQQTIIAAANTGRRYAGVSGDFNPIHLFDRTAQLFHFKQTVAHGMWSLARCMALAETALPTGPLQLDAQFKLPLYLPSEFVFRSQYGDAGVELSLSTPKGDRLHLLVRGTALN